MLNTYFYIILIITELYMKTILKVVTLTVAMVLASVANAAQDTQKIGVVFPSKIMQESPQREKIIKKLEGEFKGRYDELQKIEKEIKKIETTLKRDAELMNANDVKSLQRKAEVKVSEYKLKRKAFEEDNRRRQGEEQQKALLIVKEVINAVAAKGDYDLILNGEQIVFAKPDLDISDFVIKELSKR
jgi:outer membrane protein